MPKYFLSKTIVPLNFIELKKFHEVVQKRTQVENCSYLN